MEIDVRKVKEYNFEGNPVPDMKKEDFEQLVEDIKERGIIQDLLAFQKEGEIYVYDGRNRLRAARMAGLQIVPVVIKEINEEQVQTEMVRTALYRRHLEEGVKTKMVVWLIERMGIKVRTKERTEGESIRKISRKIGVGKSTIERAIKYKKVIEDNPELEGQPVAKVIAKFKEKEKTAEERYREVMIDRWKQAQRICENCGKFPACNFVETMLFNIEKAGCGREIKVVEPPATAVQQIVEEYKKLKGIPAGDKGWNKVFYPRFTKAAKILLEQCENDEELAREVLKEIAAFFRKKGWEWTLNTAIKPNILSIAYGRVKYGNRDKYKADVELE